jgi:VCBS repeat-containing protein
MRDLLAGGISMTNHNPTFTSSAATGAFSEDAGVTDSSALHSLSGILKFTDSDHSDTHTTSASLKSAAWSSGGVVPTSSLSDLNHALSSSITADSNGSGSIKWSFAAPDEDFDFLAKGEKLVLTYNVQVQDNHGGTAKQTVTLTVTGSDDKPTFDIAVPVSITEQAGHTLSFSPDTAHVALSFTDPDLDNTGHTAKVLSATATGNTSGILPGGFGTAELMSFYHVDNVAKAAGSSDGMINTTFSAPDLAFDYLAAGETVTIDYTVQLDDHQGGVTTQDVAVTVTGTNDAPTYISGPQSAHFTEGQASTLTAHGDLFFGDLDLSDTHTVSKSVVSATRSSGQPVPISNAELQAALATTLEDSTGHALGEVDWDFAVPNSEISFLGKNETLTVVYDVTVTDPSGASDTQTVTVTILGTNSAPVITSGPESASVSELTDTTGSAASDSATGTLAFTDGDTGDTHSVTTSLSSAVWSGGSTVPAGTLAAAQSALATTLNDSTGTGSGSVDWSFGIADNQVDFLAAGETLTLSYNVNVSDGSESAAQTVSITVTGTNDAPAITSGPESGAVAEQANMTNSSAPDSTNGTLQFSDVDLSDSHIVQVALDSAVWSGGDLIPEQTQADLSAALATALHDSRGSGTGSVDWTFSIPDKDLDFLSAGQTLTATYDVTVSDGSTSSTQTVTIVMSGASDPLTISPATVAVADTPFADAGTTVAQGNVLAGVAGDASASVTVTAVNGDPANVNHSIAGAHGTLLLFDSGTYFYTANTALDAMQATDTAADVFNFTATNERGESVTTTLTFDITGTDDNPVITAADSSAGVIEDRGPTVLVNGNFETGDLTGWTSSGSHISVEQDEFGGEFGQYTARLAPTSSLESLSQTMSTSPGQHYTVSFTLLPDVDAGSEFLSVTWNGQTLLATSDLTSGGNHYSFDVDGASTGVNSTLTFSYATDGTGILLDAIAVSPASGPPTETAAGTIQFSDVEAGDTHAASFVSQPGALGTFSLDSAGIGTGSVDWHFTVNNSDIQFLSEGQTLTQVYQVMVSDNHGGTTEQDVSVTITGTNDAPTAANQTIITDTDINNTVVIPGWALAQNGTDPDSLDTLSLQAATAGSGGTADSFAGNAVFTDDSANGGSFTYTLTDGHTSSASATATVINNAASTTTLTGTSGNDILIGVQGTGEALSGGGGNDILIAGGGAHTLTGGSGDDIFAFLQPSDGPDTITDFNNTSQHDLIAIAAAGFGSGLTPGMDVTPFFEASGDNQFQADTSLFHFDTANSTLYFSPDGTTGSELALTQVQAGITLSAADIKIT